MEEAFACFTPGGGELVGRLGGEEVVDVGSVFGFIFEFELSG